MVTLARELGGFNVNGSLLPDRTTSRRCTAGHGARPHAVGRSRTERNYRTALRRGPLDIRRWRPSGAGINHLDWRNGHSYKPRGCPADVYGGRLLSRLSEKPGRIPGP